MIEISVKDIAPVYGVLNEAKMGKMDVKDQIKLVRIVREMKRIITPYQEAEQDAREKFKGEDHDSLVKVYLDCVHNVGEHTDEERSEAIAYVRDYDKKAKDCLNDEFEKKHSVEAEKLGAEAFEKLIVSNEWNVATILAVELIIAA